MCVCVCVCDVRAGCYRWKSLGEGWEEGREAGKESSRGGDGREGEERRGEERREKRGEERRKNWVIADGFGLAGEWSCD